MIYQWVAISSAIFAGIGLILSAVAFRQQQKNTQLNLLADFTSRYLDLIDKKEDYKAKGKYGEYVVIFLNLLEWFAYAVNHKHIPEEMAEIYQGVIVNWYERMWVKQRESIQTYIEDQPLKFFELEELYKKIK